MAQIKIIAIPPGQAPLEIREAWVGLILPIAENKSSDTIQMGALGGKPENLGGYDVETKVAIKELKKKSPKAAKWWESNINPEWAPRLTFKREVCELIS